MRVDAKLSGNWQQAVAFVQAAPSKLTDSQIMAQSVGLIVRDLIKLTPPMKDWGKTRESARTQQMQGKHAVGNDIRRAIFPVDRLRFLEGNSRRSVQFHHAMREHNVPLMMTILKNIGFPAEGIITKSEIQKAHQRRRTKRGRIRVNARPYILNCPDSEGVLENYIKRRQKKVMFGKSGWAKAAHFFMKKGSRGLKGAVSKFHGNARRFGIARIERHGHNRAYVMGNTIPYMQKHGKDRDIMSHVIRSQTRTLNKRAEMAIKSQMRALGLGR
jgi:hypothetical protein